MISDKNKTIKITLSKNQIAWLERTSTKLGISKSRLIKFLIDKNISRLIASLPQEELDWMIKIAKTEWLDINKE